jgi:anaerobic magnesium-protoporphyrin IX monomethyl ester cyclase
MPKVLLTTLNAKYIHLNLAIRILYDLNKEYDGLQWHEFTIKSTLDEIISGCAGFDVVCFSCYIWNISPTLKAAAALKAHYPEIKILLGGPEVSYEWEQVIERPEVDYIIVGEGEIPFAEFLNSFPNIESVQNLVHKDKGYVQFNKSQPSFDVKEFEGRNPYIHEDSDSLKHKVAYIETSRGCPYKCSFCLASLDNKVRYLPMPTIKENLLYLMKHGKVIKFLDRTFNIKKDFTLDLFQFILDNHYPGNVFQFEITADIMHPDIIAFINDRVPKGLFRFEIGIQTVNQKSNLEVMRKQNFDKTTGVIRALEDKVDLHLDLIVGLPFEYWNDLKFSFESVFKLFPPELQLGFLKFLKGTPVRENYEQYGYKFDPEPPYQIIESDFLSKEELRQVTLMEHALEVYWNKKKAIHTLKYVAQQYSVFYFLLELGKAFEHKLDLHRYSLRDTYNVLYAFVLEHYPDDKILHQLVAIDYYSYYKTKPQPLGDAIMNKKEANAHIIASGLNHHKFRYVIIPVSFDSIRYLQGGVHYPADDLIIIEYNGTSQPRILQLQDEAGAA